MHVKISFSLSLSRQTFWRIAENLFGWQKSCKVQVRDKFRSVGFGPQTKGKINNQVRKLRQISGGRISRLLQLPNRVACVGLDEPAEISGNSSHNLPFNANCFSSFRTSFSSSSSSAAAASASLLSVSQLQDPPIFSGSQKRRPLKELSR